MNVDRDSNVKKCWTKLGSEDPYWGVLTQDRFRKGQCNVDEFYASGESTSKYLISLCEKYDIYPSTSNVLDFGVGVGRIAKHIIDKCNLLYAVDISDSYLEKCSSMFNNSYNTNYETVNYDNFYQHKFSNINLIYSFLVLQHNHPETMCDILKHFCKILNTGGICCVSIPYYIPGWSYVNRESMQMNPLPAEKVLSIINDNECKLVDIAEEHQGKILFNKYTYIKSCDE